MSSSRSRISAAIDGAVLGVAVIAISLAVVWWFASL